jgi:hypothetical protein
VSAEPHRYDAVDEGDLTEAAERLASSLMEVATIVSVACLGAHLARLELRHAFAQLRDRLERCELAGPVERTRSSFVGGIKHAPMHWRIAGGRGAGATPGV